MRKVRFRAQARRDVVDIYLWTFERFGAAARARYERLFDAAFRDLAANPTRPGVSESNDIPVDARLYHIRHSKRRAAKQGQVAKPRHFIVFRFDDEEIVILRVLHDAMDIQRHVGGESAED